MRENGFSSWKRRLARVEDFGERFFARGFMKLGSFASAPPTLPNCFLSLRLWMHADSRELLFFFSSIFKANPDNLKGIITLILIKTSFLTSFLVL